jgi:hypothetical protein
MKFELSRRELVGGLEISLVGFLVCPFFLTQAYTWNLYYLLGMSGAFRRIAWKAELRHPEFFEWDDENSLEYEEEA